MLASIAPLALIGGGTCMHNTLNIYITSPLHLIKNPVMKYITRLLLIHTVIADECPIYIIANTTN